MWPRWTSIPVGSMPYLTRKGPVLAERPLELLAEFVLGDDLLDPAAEDLELFFKVRHRSARLLGTRR